VIEQRSRKVAKQVVPQGRLCFKIMYLLLQPAPIYITSNMASCKHMVILFWALGFIL
jgi:hypothetical protein